MKNIIKVLGIIAVGVIIATMLVSCGDNPKSLAKETINIIKQAMVVEDNPTKMAELERRMEALGKKVENLSEKDREIYENEVNRLSTAVDW
jgi:hypothetical protein